MIPSDIPDEKNRKLATRWEKVADFFYVAAQAMTPVAQIPVVNLIANPIVNGLWGIWSVAYSIAFKYNADLKSKKEQQERYFQAQSTFNKASYLVGGVAMVAGFLTLIPPLWPITIPILLPIAAIATVASNILWSAGIVMNFYKEIKKSEGEKEAGHRWRVASHASAVLYSIGSIVIAALVVAALFTPVGWGIGAGAMTFAIAGAAASLAVFGVSKFFQWQAHRRVAEHLKTDSIKEIEMQNLPKKVELTKETEIDCGLPHKEFLPEFHHELEQAVSLGVLARRETNQDKKKEREKEGKGKQGSEEPSHHDRPH